MIEYLFSIFLLWRNLREKIVFSTHRNSQSSILSGKITHWNSQISIILGKITL